MTTINVLIFFLFSFWLVLNLESSNACLGVGLWSCGKTFPDFWISDNCAKSCTFLVIFSGGVWMVLLLYRLNSMASGDSNTNLVFRAFRLPTMLCVGNVNWTIVWFIFSGNSFACDCPPLIWHAADLYVFYLFGWQEPSHACLPVIVWSSRLRNSGYYYLQNRHDNGISVQSDERLEHAMF